MKSKKAFTYEELQELIPVANQEQVKFILDTIKTDRSHYDSSTFTKILLIVSKRTLELSQQLRSKHAP